MSIGLVSKFFVTWVCFAYQQLKEIDWTLLLELGSATLPCAFQDKYPTTYSIIDGTEVFLQTPLDLFMQSSTWSSYKHHNTAYCMGAPQMVLCRLCPNCMLDQSPMLN